MRMCNKTSGSLEEDEVELKVDCCVEYFACNSHYLIRTDHDDDDEACQRQKSLFRVASQRGTFLFSSQIHTSIDSPFEVFRHSSVERFALPSNNGRKYSSVV